MNVEFVVVLVGVFIFISIFALLAVVFRRRIDVHRRIRSGEAAEGTVWQALIEKFEELLKPLGEIVPRSPEEMSKHEKRLAQAGIRRKDGVVLFHASQVVLAIAFLAASLGLGYLYSNPLLSLAVSVFLGVMAPEFWLSKTIEARKERIQLALPDALDLAVVCVEAGLALDQSLMRIADELKEPYPDLSEEFRLRNIEINMGRSRAEAFRNLAERSGVDDVKSLVAILIQTDRFGTSVGQALRVFAESLRIKRQQRARERAAKLPVKMIPVMIVLIFPSIFVVVVGPAVIQIVRVLLPSLVGN